MAEEADLGGHVVALNNCPHVNISCSVPNNETLSKLASLIANPICCINNCNKTECWFCLKCHKLFCSRYANKHMNSHYSQSINKCHCIAMGIKDLSFWCYKCDSYINHLTIQKIFEIYEIAHIAKHNETIPKELLKQAKFNYNDDAKNENIKCKYLENAAEIIKKEFNLPDIYFYKNKNMCYCLQCHLQRGDENIYSRGGSNYALPIGWCRIGIKTNEGFCKMNNVWDKWHVAFHGTSKETIPLIFKGDLKLLKPGDIALGGVEIGIVTGHIKKKKKRTNLYTGKQEIFDPNQIYLSPSIKYSGCDVYSKWSKCVHPTRKNQNIRVKFAFQARIRPGSYGIGQETIGATKRKEIIDENFNNNALEWYTKENMGILLYGLLLKFELQ